MQIFLSYRRSESSEFASQCFEYFSSRNGPRSIFWDKQSIPLDADWKDSIRENIDKADAVLCIVGPRWNELLRDRRADPDDCVRFELEYALDRRRPIVVVLINGASSPIADQLPDRLKSIAKLQAGAFNSATPIASFRLLDNRLQQFAPQVAAPQVAAPRLWSQAAAAGRPWVDRGLQSPSQHASWWQLWNFHDEGVVGRITEVLSEQSAEAGVVLLAGPENSGRRYLIDAAVRKLRADGGTVQLLRINLDGYEPESADPLAAYLRFQAQRLGIQSGRGQRQNDFEQLIGWLKAELSGGVSSKATCASVGMLLELCGSFAGVLRLLRGVVLRAAVREHIRLLTCLLEFFCMQRRTIVHVEDSVVDQFLRDDLVSLCQSQPQLRLVLSSLPDVNPTAILGYRPGIRIDVPRFDDNQLRQVLQSRFGPNDIPEWLVRLLRQETQGNRGLTARLLIDLFQDDVLQWDSQNNWFAAPPAAKAHAPASLRRLLQPLDRLFQDTPHLESLMRLAALCGELIPMTLLLDFLRVPVEERDDLMEVIDERLCDGAEAIPILADLGFSHPGFRMQRKINVYRFLCPLDRDLLLQGTTAAWQQQQAQELLEFLEIAMPESTRGLASLYLQLHEYLPDGQVACQALRERLQWWITKIEGERFRNYISKAINSGQLSGDAVWQAIQHNRGKGSPAMRLNLLLGYEQQKDGIPVENAGLFYGSKGLMLLKLAQFAEAEVYLREALRIYEKADGPDHPLVATSLNNLAELLRVTNRLSEAEPLYRRALSIYETSYGPDHPSVATSLNNLATLLYATNRLSEAEPLYRRALSIHETSYGPDHPEVATDLNNLAELLRATNRLSAAEPLFRRALAIHETSYGPGHPLVAGSLNNLATLLCATNRPSEAEPLSRRALSIRETSYGPDHPEVAGSLNNLAGLLRVTNRLSEAEPLYRRALSIHETSYGPDHPEVATSLNNLAELLRATNRPTEAEKLFRRALSIDETSYGPDHPEVAGSLNNLAGLLRVTNRLSEAEPLYRRALSIHETSYGPDHPEVARDLNNLAVLLSVTKRLSEAEPLYRRALSIDETSYGPDHPEVATSLSNLAGLLRDTNRLSAAEPLYRRALSIHETSYGPDHPEVAGSLNNLAGLLRDTNRLSEAEPLFRRALSIHETSYGPDHPEVGTNLNNLAALLRATNRLSEAEPLLRRALSIRETSYGPDHPEVATSLNNLAGLLRDTTRLSEAEPLSRRAVEILVLFTARTGHEHPHLGVVLGNYWRILNECGFDAAATESRLRELLQRLKPTEPSKSE